MVQIITMGVIYMLSGNGRYVVRVGMPCSSAESESERNTVMMEELAAVYSSLFADETSPPGHGNTQKYPKILLRKVGNAINYRLHSTKLYYANKNLSGYLDSV